MRSFNLFIGYGHYKNLTKLNVVCFGRERIRLHTRAYEVCPKSIRPTFLITKVLCTINMPQEVGRSTKNFTSKFWKDRVTRCEENGRIFGRMVNGFFASLNSFWQNTKNTQLRQTPYTVSVTFGCFEN